MCTALQGLPSPIVVRGSAATPAYTHNGIPFDSDGALAVQDAVIRHYNQGLPFTESGRIAATMLGAVVNIENGAAPFTAESKLAIAGLASPITHYANGVGFTADSKVAVDPAPTPFGLGTLTTDSGDPLTTDSGDYLTRD